MAIRARRALVGLATAAAVLILPASALAAGETLTVTPASTQAGGATNVSAALTFAAGDTPQTVITSLAPGMLGNLNANPACLAAQQLTSACQVGTATVQTSIPASFSGNLYLVPGQGTDAEGIEFVPAGPPLTNQYIGVSLNQKAPGGLNLTTTFPNPTPAQITGFTANFTTLNGQPFTRLPSSCSAATSTFSATYYSGATGSGSGSFTPTGCSSLGYAPSLSATVTKDAKDKGAQLVLGITQAATEAASKTITVGLGKSLQPNVGADVPCLTGSGAGCTIGTASATSPLVPSAALANGVVTLGGTATAPTFAITFPAPFAVTLNGIVDLATNSVTFNNVPDVPLTSLTLTVTGPNGQKAFNVTSCAASNVSGSFTAQSGQTATSNAGIKFVNCASNPTASGAFSGLATGHPKLRFKATHGSGGPNIPSVAVGLPSGLKFSRSAFVTHKTCVTKKGKKQCTTITQIKGLGVSGASVKSVALKGGKLVITLKKAAGSVTVNLSGPVLTESGSLQTKVKKHKVKNLTVNLKIGTTTVPLKLAAH